MTESEIEQLRISVATLRGWKHKGPRFGAGLAGGNWKTIENLIFDTLCVKDIDTTIYDLDAN